MLFGCNRIFYDYCIANFPERATVKEFWSSVSICRSYDEFVGGLVFDLPCRLFAGRVRLQEPQYLTLLSTLEDVNIYVALNAKKVLNAPTNFGFCLRVCYLMLICRQIPFNLCPFGDSISISWTDKPMSAFEQFIQLLKTFLFGYWECAALWLTVKSCLPSCLTCILTCSLTYLLPG